MTTISPFSLSLPYRTENRRFSTLSCTKTGSTQPKLSAACFVVQSCLADADFVVSSNYCLIGTRQKLRFFSLCVLQAPDPCRAGCRHPAPVNRCTFPAGPARPWRSRDALCVCRAGRRGHRPLRRSVGKPGLRRSSCEAVTARQAHALVVAIRTSVPLVGRMPLSARPKPAAYLSRRKNQAARYAGSA